MPWAPKGESGEVKEIRQALQSCTMTSLFPLVGVVNISRNQQFSMFLKGSIKVINLLTESPNPDMSEGPGWMVRGSRLLRSHLGDEGEERRKISLEFCRCCVIRSPCCYVHSIAW